MRFYVCYDEFTADRLVNRLVHSAIHKLIGLVQQPRNQQLLHQLRVCFFDIPQSTRLEADWQWYQVDRSMQHYETLMRWVGLFPFNHGLATFAGKHVNQALLFPMEEVFEDLVTRCFGHYQEEFDVQAQGPKKALAKIGGKEAFWMKPDISLKSGNQVKFILDTKWKRINEEDANLKHGISQADMYQLYSYGKSYDCRKVALIYPKTKEFKSELKYRFVDGLELFCFPFDVTEPRKSVKDILEGLS